MSSLEQPSPETETPAPSPWAFAKPLASEAGLDGELLQLGPKAERAFAPTGRARAFYVAAGTVTVTVGASNIMLGEDGFLPVAADRKISVRNHGEGPATVLALLLPEPRVQWRMFVPGEPVAPQV